jgi:hypothetical protein
MKLTNVNAKKHKLFSSYLIKYLPQKCFKSELKILLRSISYPCNRPWSPQGCETLRLPHFLDNQLTDIGEAVSLKSWPPLTPQEHSWYSFLLEAESTPGP